MECPSPLGAVWTDSCLHVSSILNILDKTHFSRGHNLLIYY
jgi:hypothetical protein